ncbi:hypothetical protein RRG08_018724, partial [Elysia crispata]
MAVFLMQVIIGVLLLLLFSAASIAQKVYCGPGQQLEEGLEGASDHCVPCPHGFFQDRDHHSDTSCYQCAGFNDHDPLRRLVTECTRFHDTVVRCVKGFFYVYDPIGGDCLKCTNCTLLRGKYYEIQACSDTEDAICCDKEDMMVKDGTCVEPLVCGPGQFLVPAQADREEECRQCELESSNPEVHHRKRSCDQRQRDSDDEGGDNESSDKETGDFRRHPGHTLTTHNEKLVRDTKNRYTNGQRQSGHTLTTHNEKLVRDTKDRYTNGQRQSGHTLTTPI